MPETSRTGVISLAVWYVITMLVSYYFSKLTFKFIEQPFIKYARTIT
ncbi:hypothetical protein SAMN06272759_12717 [Novosphingobium sp. B1]|nr:hypothetical protein SAMN06272759_12717 [Novosphingobium sp. B1]